MVLFGEAPNEGSVAFYCLGCARRLDSGYSWWFRVRGEAGRYRLIGRERAYHGVGFGGISVGGIVANRRTYGPMLAGEQRTRAVRA